MAKHEQFPTSDPVVETRGRHRVWQWTLEHRLRYRSLGVVTFVSRDWRNPVVSEVRLTCIGPPSGVTHQILLDLVSDLRLGGLATQLADTTLGAWLKANPQQLHGQLINRIQESPRRSRPPRPDEQLLDVALLFVEALHAARANPAHRPNPYGEMRVYVLTRPTTPDWLRKGKASAIESRLRRLVAQCRRPDRDLLTPTSQGKTEGELTPKARRLRDERQRGGDEGGG